MSKPEENQKAEYYFYLLGGLKETVIYRTPAKKIAHRKLLLPALTKMASHYEQKQKDIAFIEFFAGHDGDKLGPDSDYDRIRRTYAGEEGRFQRIDLWDWNESTQSFDLFRPRPYTYQMELADKAVPFADTFPEGHPGHCDPHSVEWKPGCHIRLTSLGPKEQWIARATKDIPENEHAQVLDNIRRSHNPYMSDVVILYRDNVPYVWNGQARILSGYLNNDDLVTALIADAPSLEPEKKPSPGMGM